MKSLFCPISNERVEENTVRVTGFLIALLLTTSFLTGEENLLGFVVFDYFIRAFTDLKYSPLSWLAQQLLVKIKSPIKPIDKAPKIFAARVGFLFASSGFLLLVVDPMISFVVLTVLCFFALLESMVNLCMGCLVYTHVVAKFFM